MDKWDKLYSWLNDFAFAIAPDETVTDYEERQSRLAQYDVLQEVLEMMIKIDGKERTNDRQTNEGISRINNGSSGDITGIL